MHNIEKSKVRSGQYVGHATGAWHIKRSGGVWRALKTSGQRFTCDPPSITGRTLREVSEALDALNVKIKEEIAGYDNAVAAVAVEMSRDLVLPNPFGRLGDAL